MTLEEKYYAINERLITYLKSKGIKLPVIQGGINASRLKNFERNQGKAKLPYLQTYITNIREQTWTQRDGGIFTWFDFQLSFFTGPGSEYVDKTKFYYPYQVAKDAFYDIDIHLLKNIASLLSSTGHYEDEIKSGQITPAAFMVFKMSAICSYRAIVPDATLATDTDSALILDAK